MFSHFKYLNRYLVHNQVCNHNYYKHSGDNYEELVIVEDNGVTVISGVVTGLGENRWHGFHVHEFGDLSNGCKACGGHFNPYEVSQ